MASLDDLKDTPAWQKADEAKRKAMTEAWDAHPNERAGYLVIANGRVPASLLSSPEPQPTPSAPPQPLPGAAAPGRQQEWRPETPYLATMLGLGGSLAATAAFPQVTIPALAARVGIPAILGGIGGAIDPRDTAAEGATREALAQAGGEAGGKLLSGAARLVRGSRAAARDLPRVAKAIGEAVPWLKPYVEPTEESLTKLFRSGAHQENAVEIAGKSLGLAKDSIDNMVGGTRFSLQQVPSSVRAPGTAQTFQEADATLTQLRKMAELESKAAGQPATEIGSYKAGQMRAAYKRARKEFIAQLNAAVPGAGDFYREASQQFYNVSTLQKIMSTPGVIDEGGKLNLKVLQKAVQEDAKLSRRLGTESMQKFVKALGRGKFPVGQDIPFKSPVHFYAGSHWPHMRMPQLPRKVGVPAAATRRTGAIVPALLAGQEAYDYLLNPDDTLKPGQSIRRP